MRPRQPGVLGRLDMPADRVGDDRGVTGDLQRRLGLGDAVVIGLGAMLGAGVFAAFGPAARRPPATGLLLALGVAAVVAYCNAIVQRPAGGRATRSPAAPTSTGGEQLGPFAGVPRRLGVRGRQDGELRGDGADRRGVRVAGARPAGRGRRGARADRGELLAASPRPLGPDPGAGRRCTLVGARPGGGRLPGRRRRRPGPAAPGRHRRRTGVLQAAGLLFFAFAGYARIATLGEEVRDPAADHPAGGAARARAWCWSSTLVVARGVLAVLGADRLAGSRRAAGDAVAAGRLAGLAPLVRVGAVAAVGGAAARLLAGVGRTTLAMARRPGPARLRWPRCTRATRCRTAPSWPSAALVVADVAVGDVRDGDRLLQPRRAGLLRDRQRRGAGPCRAPRPAGARSLAAARAGRLPAAGGDAAGRGVLAGLACSPPGSSVRALRHRRARTG